MAPPENFDTSTAGGAGDKYEVWSPHILVLQFREEKEKEGQTLVLLRLVSKKCKLVCFGVKIMNFVFFGVKKSGISVFLVSVENGAGVNKMTNITYEWFNKYQKKKFRMNIWFSF